MSNTFMHNKPIKIALIGCGRISNKHFESIQNCKDDLKLIAICDNNIERLEKAKETHKVNAYLSIDELLAKENPDLVSVCTPSGLHPEHTIKIAKHKIHVITEKPMATSLKDAKHMLKVCEEYGTKLFVVKQNRFNKTIQSIKQAIDNNNFGKIYMAQANVFWTRHQSYYDQDKWRGTWKLDGGALMNQASHYVDLLEWLIGPIVTVQAMAGTLARNIETEDTIALNLGWQSGTIGSMAITMLTYPKNLEGSITILGEKGTVKVGGIALNEIQYWQFEDNDICNPSENTNYQTDSVYGFGHLDYYKNVIAALRGKTDIYVDGKEGLKSLEVIIAAYKAVNEKKSIILPLLTEELENVE